MSYYIVLPSDLTPSTTWLGKANQGTWSAAHDAASSDPPTGWAPAISAGKETYGFWVRRGFISFNTAMLSAVSLIAAVVKISIDYAATGGPYSSEYKMLHLVEGVQNLPPVASDYGAHLGKTTTGGSDDNWAYQQESNIALNATGLGWINKSGITKFCLRIGADLLNLDPPPDASWGVGWSIGLALEITYNNPSTLTAVVDHNHVTLYGSYTRPYTTYIPLLEIEYSGSPLTYPFLCFAYGKQANLSEASFTAPQRNIKVGEAFTQLVRNLEPQTKYYYQARWYYAGDTYRAGTINYFWTGQRDVPRRRVLGIQTFYQPAKGQYEQKLIIGDIVE